MSGRADKQIRTSELSSRLAAGSETEAQRWRGWKGFFFLSLSLWDLKYKQRENRSLETEWQKCAEKLP